MSDQLLPLLHRVLVVVAAPVGGVVRRVHEVGEATPEVETPVSAGLSRRTRPDGVVHGMGRSESGVGVGFFGRRAACPDPPSHPRGPRPSSRSRGAGGSGPVPVTSGGGHPGGDVYPLTTPSPSFDHCRRARGWGRAGRAGVERASVVPRDSGPRPVGYGPSTEVRRPDTLLFLDHP